MTIKRFPGKVLVVSMAAAVSVQAADYFVATDGSNAAAGTHGAPFATIQHGADQLAAGDTLTIRGGRYHEAVSVSGLSGVGTTWSGGTGWSEDWTLGADTSSAESAGNTVAKMVKDGSITRTLDSAVSGGTLSFKWDVDSLDNSSEIAYAEVYDGTWHPVWSVDNLANEGNSGGNPDNLQSTNISLAAYGTVTQVQFRLSASGAADYFFVDDIAVGAATDDFEGTLPPIIIRNYNNETVTLDGSVDIDSIATNGWTHYRDGIFQRSVTQDVWQLFLDDKMVDVGRWPDASFEDGSIWSRDDSMDVWSYGTSNGNGTATFDSLTNFPASGRADFLEGVAVLNYHHWLTAAKDMLSIDWETGTIGLEDTFATKSDLAGYVLGLGCIDRDNEWWFDDATQSIYYRAPGAVDPSTFAGSLSGRVLDYAITFDNVSNVQLQGINFFSGSAAVKSSCDGVVIDSCHFKYPNEYKFMLEVLDTTDPKNYLDPAVNNVCFVIDGTNCVLENSVFEYSNTHIVLSGSDMRVENNLFHDVEWDVVSTGGSGSVNLGERMQFLRNRVYRCGNSEGVRPLSQLHDSEVAYNQLSQMSLLQVDGAAINVSLHSRRNHVHHNWVHDSKRAAIRWDWYNDLSGSEEHGGCFHHNVTWNCPQWQIKNDDNVLFNNVGSLNASVYFSDAPGSTNDDSVAINNLTQKMFQHGVLLRDNHTELGNEFDLLRDWQSFDFRPASSFSPLVDAGSDLLLSEIPGLATYSIPVPNDGTKADILTVGNAPDIGAYEYGSAAYWIPGRKTAQASMPIPANGATTDPLDRDLIYLIGYKGISANILMGTNPAGLSPITSQANPTNIVELATLDENSAYYWRVDTVLGDSSVVTGEVWSFTTGALPPDQASMPVPSDGATGQPFDSDLSYLIGLDGIGANIYFSTNPVALPLIANLNEPTNVVELATLNENTTYYWRVDTVHTDTSVVTGEVWSFTTGSLPSISVASSSPTNDVIESYNVPATGAMGPRRQVSTNDFDRAAGQAFTITTDTSVSFEGITLRTANAIYFSGDASNHTFLVALMKDTDGNGKTDLQIGDTYSFVMTGQDWANGDDYLTFHFGVPITGLEPGLYSFHTYFGEEHDANNFAFRRDVGTGTYAGGGQVSKSNPPVFPNANLTPSPTGNDFVFFIHGTEESTHTFNYWIAQYGLSAGLAAYSADIEPDGMDNLLEYALGGNPTNNDASTIFPRSGMVNDDGANWMEYVYRRREDFVERGLDYSVEVSTNLVSNVWNTNGVILTGVSLPISGIETVTNRVSTEDAPQKFIHLEITENE
ncbi:right-handed parallel beta-helix repeat-containing protein [Pontiella sulfatireligans]|nr:right-handed parallel beta-helix repeat-containing protein [Pontiella sulfatireligans]